MTHRALNPRFARLEFHIDTDACEVRNVALASNMAKDGDGFLGATVRTKTPHLVAHQINQIKGILLEVITCFFVDDI